MFLNFVRRGIRAIDGKIGDYLQESPIFRWRIVESGLLTGHWFYLPDGSWGDEVVSGEYEKEFMELIKRTAAKGGYFYDVGAHIGLFSLAFVCAGGAQVESFEPFPYNIKIVKETIEKNFVQDKIRLHTIALGNFTGNGTLVENPRDSSRTRVCELGDHISGNNLSDNTNKVSVWKLDDLFQVEHLSAPSLIKIDVEGAEVDVLEGAKDVIMKYRPSLLVEIHSTNTGLDFADRMARLGYRMEIVGGKGKNKTLPLCLWTAQ